MSGRSYSSRDREPESPRATSPIPDTEVTIPEIVFRDRHEIEKRERMRMSKLNESEEFMQSVNSNFSENHFKNHELDAINEGDDEIRLDSDSTGSLSESSTELSIFHVCFPQQTNALFGATDYWPRSGRGRWIRSCITSSVWVNLFTTWLFSTIALMERT